MEPFERLDCSRNLVQWVTQGFFLFQMERNIVFLFTYARKNTDWFRFMCVTVNYCNQNSK